ncbi:MAG TPA: tyrosine-type recombinase/integrase [Chloroflexota bacterium]|jgi:integrase
MVARRANGEGSIGQCSDGRWEATIQIAGRRYWRQGKTQAEVRTKLNELRCQSHLGQLIEPKRLTLGEFLEQWLEAGAADWKAKTTHGYRTIVRCYWKPELGHIQIQKLTPPMLVASYARWRPDHSGGTLLNVHRCLHRALVVAVRWGLVARNVADAVEPPKAQRHTPALWSQEQAAQFLQATRQDAWHPLWALLLGTGCRPGEAAGLRWRHVDLDSGTVSISSAIGYVGTVPVEETPKTRSGIRTISLPGFTADALRAWKAQTGAVDADGLLFPLPDGRAPAPWHIKAAFLRACRSAGLPPIRRHDLRHLAASLMLAE